MDPHPFNLDSVPGSRPLDPSLRLEAVPYQPDGGCSPFGMVILFTCCVLAALGLGYAAAWVNQWFYIILLFPFLVGLGLGFLGAVGVSLGRVRNTLLTVLAGLFSGFLAMAAMHYFNYQRFLAQPRQEKVRPGQIAAPAQLPPDVGLLKYLDDKARKEGIPVHFRRIHLNLGYIGAYIYWIVEVLIAGGMACVIMWACAIDPFCTQCQDWKDKRFLGTLAMAPETAVAIFTNGEIVRLADHDFPPGNGQIQLTAWVCKNCGAEAPVDVKLEQAITNSKDEEETRQIAYVTYPGQALPVLESLFAPLEPAPEPADVPEEVEE